MVLEEGFILEDTLMLKEVGKEAQLTYRQENGRD